MADPILPFSVWESGTNQNSIPANDNSLRSEILNGLVISKSVTAQPSSPSNGDIYILAATHTGSQWAAFDPDDMVIFKDGTWYEFAPSQGVVVNFEGHQEQYTGSTGWESITTGGGSFDMFSMLSSAEISVTTTANLTIGRMHVCSGTTADYAVTLPAVSGNAGKFIGLRIASGCTRWITLTGNGAELIDGSNTRRMWAQESATLFCDGSTWSKMSGRSRALHCILRRTTGALSIAPAGWFPVPMNVAVVDNASALAVPLFNSTDGRVRALRLSTYEVSGFGAWTGVVAGKLQAVGVVKWTVASGTPNNPKDEPNTWSGVPASTVGDCYINSSGSYTSTVLTDEFTLTCFNNDTVNRSIASAASLYPTISVLEVPAW